MTDLPGRCTQTGAFPTFAAAVAERFEQGAVAYGNRSFHLPPDLLADEIEQELLDLADQIVLDLIAGRWPGSGRRCACGLPEPSSSPGLPGDG